MRVVVVLGLKLLQWLYRLVLVDQRVSAVVIPYEVGDDASDGVGSFSVA